MSRKTIALVGDYSEEVTAHRAIPRALQLARESLGADVDWTWIKTRDIRNPSSDLAPYCGLWVVPASPYENTEGALGAIRWARESARPFLGTCGGFQHAILEFGRNVAGIAGAVHAETNPGGADLLLTRLSCSLVEVSGRINFDKGSLLGRAHASGGVMGEYHCNYGLNSAYRPVLETAGLRFTAWDDAGEIRGAELASHPFFCGVLFQPERSALRGELPPLALAFVRAAVSG
jgi:CTP synthase (UTP-ammonia lyase)